RHHLDDIAAVIFTRGRTGNPKGVQLTHRNLAAAAMALAKSYELVPQDRLHCTLSPSQSTSFTFGLWTPLTVGMSIIIADQPKEPTQSDALASSSLRLPFAGEDRREGAGAASPGSLPLPSGGEGRGEGAARQEVT